MPYKNWPNLVSVNEEDLFGDKDKLLKGRHQEKVFLVVALH